MVLDWDLVRIEGQVLDTWLPSVFKRMDALALEAHASLPVGMGAFIEDKGIGSIFLRVAARQDLPLLPIEKKIAEVGTDERAVNASSYVHQGQIKFTDEAHAKVVDYQGAKANHLLNQIAGFAPGAKDVDAEMLNCFAFGVAIGLGHEEGL